MKKNPGVKKNTRNSENDGFYANLKPLASVKFPSETIVGSKNFQYWKGPKISGNEAQRNGSKCGTPFPRKQNPWENNQKNTQHTWDLLDVWDF